MTNEKLVMVFFSDLEVICKENLIENCNIPLPCFYFRYRPDILKKKKIFIVSFQPKPGKLFFLSVKKITAKIYLDVLFLCLALSS